MTRGLRLALRVTDIAFLFYWAIAALDTGGILDLPSDWLYPNAHDPRVIAWNWSFLPLDIAFSITGLLAVHASAQGKAIWRPLALISLVLTMVAGGMACSYWLLIGEIDVTWFGMNLLLLIWPLAFLRKLVREMAVKSASEN